jgi:hypothetical protein
MKKILIAVIALLLVVACCGCVGSECKCTCTENPTIIEIHLYIDEATGNVIVDNVENSDSENTTVIINEGDKINNHPHNNNNGNNNRNSGNNDNNKNNGNDKKDKK